MHLLNWGVIVGIQTDIAPHYITTDKCDLGQFHLCGIVVVVQLDQLCWIRARFSHLNAPPVLSLLSSTSQTVSSNLEMDIYFQNTKILTAASSSRCIHLGCILEYSVHTWSRRGSYRRPDTPKWAENCSSAYFRRWRPLRRNCWQINCIWSKNGHYLKPSENNHPTTFVFPSQPKLPDIRLNASAFDAVVLTGCWAAEENPSLPMHTERRFLYNSAILGEIIGTLHLSPLPPVIYKFREQGRTRNQSTAPGQCL